MGFLKWYDWITPTNPYSSVLFGVLFSIILMLVVWFDTKKLKQVD